MKPVVVFGAAGFVGATVCERLLARGWDVRACMHSAGNAWRLSRHGIPLHAVDVRDAAAVRAALEGRSAVVNCVLGPKDVMMRGLDVQLAESRRAGIARFVHLSSVSAWGDREPGSTLHSDDAPSASLTDYGVLKRDQDQKLVKALERGLPCTALAPPNISGAHSPFWLRITRALATRRLALIDGGALPCSLIDVENLAAAIEAALVAETSDARPILVTDDDDVTWRDVVACLAPLAGIDPAAVPSLSRVDAVALLPKASPPSILDTARRLAGVAVGAEARAALKSDRIAQRVYGWVTEGLPGGLGPKLRKRMSGGTRRAPFTSRHPGYESALLRTQTRAVRHDAVIARDRLAYAPVLSAAESATAFARYYRATHPSDPAETALLAPGP